MGKRSLPCAAAVLLITAVLYAAETGGIESAEWTRIIIKEAFISRQTSIDFRDLNSAPEFGWQVKCGGTFAAGGRSLYATLYAPCPVTEDIRLYLMELDILSDDIVSGVTLEREKSKFVLNGNGDFAVLEIAPLYPDAKSGGDALPTGAVDLRADRHDSVSFLDGDYTDCHRLPAGVSGAVIIASSPSLTVDTPEATGMVIHPIKKTITTVAIVASEKGREVVRLRAPVPVGRVNYSISPVTKGPGITNMMQTCLKHIPGEKTLSRSFLCKDMARALISLDRDGALTFCAAAAGSSPAAGESAADCLCGAVRQETKVIGSPGHR
jgi:hypothetical protein